MEKIQERIDKLNRWIDTRFVQMSGEGFDREDKIIMAGDIARYQAEIEILEKMLG